MPWSSWHLRAFDVDTRYFQEKDHIDPYTQTLDLTE